MILLEPDTTIRSATVFAHRNEDGTYSVVTQFALNGGVHTQVSSPSMSRDDADRELINKLVRL